MKANKDNRNLIAQYAGFAFQLIAGLGLTLYLGMWLDKKLQLSIPLLVWILPLLILIVTFSKLIKDTSTKK